MTISKESSLHYGCSCSWFPFITASLVLLGVVTVHPRNLEPDARHLSSRVVNTRYGALRGFISTLSNRQLQPVEVFLGVPYAGAPRGALRFMPPGTSPHWKGVRLADHFASVCPQKLPDIKNETEALNRMPLGRYNYLKRLLPHLMNQSEDCLYLNIYAPAAVARQPAKLPVMVFIHGESYEWNAGNPYDGRVLSSFGNVVVVTINYRLGVLGFLPAVDRSARGNYGLMDQVAGLHWIQDNIENFGGDPNNVTIFGQGHGAACVNLLMLSPMARGLFHRAIMQSGSALSPWAIARDAVSYTRRLAETLQCPYHDNTALVDCLRKVTLQDIMAVDLPVPDHLTGFGPTVDGIVLPQDPATLMSEQPQLFSQFDLLFGTTRVENYFQFSAAEEKFGIESSRRDRIIRTLVRNLYTYHLQEIFLTIVNEYMDWSRPLLHATDIFDGTIDAIGDATVVAPLVRTGSYRTGISNREYSNPSYLSRSNEGGSKKSFFYVFAHQTEGGDYASRLGCISGEDLPYVFGAPLVTSLSHFGANYTKSESVLSEVTMTHWTNFAKLGDPNIVSTQESDSQSDNVRGRYERVTWPLYEPEYQKYLSIAMKPRVRDHYHAHRLSYWLNLIPRLHRSGDVNVSSQHHRLPDHDNPLSYDGIVRRHKLGYVSFAGLDEAISTTTLPPESSKSATLLIEFRNRSSIGDSRTEDPSEANQSGNLTDTHLMSSQSGGVYSTALSVTIAVGCSLLILNVLIFAGIYYQKDKDNLEKKLHKAFYQDRRSEDEEGHPSGEKPFLVKDLSSSMMLTQFGSPQEFDGGQSLDLVQPSKTIHNQMPQQSGSNNLSSSSANHLLISRTPQGDRGHEAQPLLASTQHTPTAGGNVVTNSHTVTATVDCIPPWTHHAQEITVFGVDSHS